jgi:hypothetical protein
MSECIQAAQSLALHTLVSTTTDAPAAFALSIQPFISQLAALAAHAASHTQAAAHLISSYYPGPTAHPPNGVNHQYNTNTNTLCSRWLLPTILLAVPWWQHMQ